MEERLNLSGNDLGARLDVLVTSRVPDWISRSYVQKGIKDGLILVNGDVKKPSYKIKDNDVITMEIPDKPEPVEIKPENIPINIIYEDKDMIVINKDADMVVHPSGNRLTGTLVNAVMHHCPNDLTGISGEMRPGIVHRLDKDTSGIIVIAKTELALQRISHQFKERITKKSYMALVKGDLKSDSGTINAPIGRHPTMKIKMAVVVDGRESLTLYKVMKRFDGLGALVSIDLKTGRTHQIRVHFKHIGHPLFGDEVYGKANEDFKYDISRQMLHAFRLGLYHPRTEKWMEFVAPIPNDFRKAIVNLNNSCV